MARTLGYSARADVLLTRDDGQKRLWIEFEVSRADPVANHAKFATSHLFQPQASTDTFIAMVSSHVTRGRRNLAANTIQLMRRVGMRAFQTMLLPTMSPDEIKRLNHLPMSDLLNSSIDTESGTSRALLVSNAVSSGKDYELHYAGDLFDVLAMFNVGTRSSQPIDEKNFGESGQLSISYLIQIPTSSRRQNSALTSNATSQAALGLEPNHQIDDFAALHITG